MVSTEIIKEVKEKEILSMTAEKEKKTCKGIFLL